jgi:hypothetical protein
MLLSDQVPEDERIVAMQEHAGYIFVATEKSVYRSHVTFKTAFEKLKFIEEE